jgi:histidinol-phosphate/aromatic aminotransferase/cobyric acid decarboxylase-like protein
VSAALDFAGFLAWSAAAREATPDVRVLCETRVAALSAIRPAIDLPPEIPRVHRCHLARDWCALRGVPADRAATAFVTEGVRAGLRQLCQALASEGRTLAIPDDVYPVYGRIAGEAGVRSHRFATFPVLDLDTIFAACDRAGAAVVLLPAPLKLHGRRWTAAEVATARAWLARHPARRLILDGVYSFGAALDPGVLALIATEQVIYLDSCSKGWLHELVFGVALLPASDAAAAAVRFREAPPRPAQLWQASQLLDRHRDTPAALATWMERARQQLAVDLAARGLRTLAVEQGYLIAIEAAPDTLLARHGLLTIPASVFGANAPGWSIASVLPARDPRA